MEALWVSAGVVAVAEIGDKTQLLSILLAARFKSPRPIILGILVATLANHALAAWAGSAVAEWMGPETTRGVLAISFLAMAAWTLVPDQADDAGARLSRFGAFASTLIAFFLVEIGDKTQIATVALAARFDNLPLVVLGSTVGMMAANVPAVLLGEIAATRFPMKWARLIAAVIFAALGLLLVSDFGALIARL